MKAALKVPSANNRLKVLGSLNATKNASAKIDAPRKQLLKYPLDNLNPTYKRKKLNIEAEESRFIENLN